MEEIGLEKCNFWNFRSSDLGLGQSHTSVHICNQNRKNFLWMEVQMDGQTHVSSNVLGRR